MVFHPSTSLFIVVFGKDMQLSLLSLLGEALNQIIKQEMHIGNIEGVTFLNKNKQKISSQYVDDATLTIKVEQKNVEKTIEILNIFQDTFNLEINWFKSCAFG